MKQKKITPTLCLIVIVCAAFMVGGCSKQKAGKEEAMSEENPFFVEWQTPFKVPPFDRIKVEHYLPAIKEGIRRHQEEVAAIADNTEPATFENTIAALAESGSFLSRVADAFNVLNDSMTNEQMQAVAKESAPLRAKHQDEILLNEKLFARIKTVNQQKDQLKLTREQERLLEKYHKDFVRGGANLEPQDKARLKEINEKLSVLTLKFGENNLKEDNTYALVIEDEKDLAGLPGWVIDAGAEAAAERGHQGKWAYTLHRASITPFLRYADNRALREKIFKAYIGRGSSSDEMDNKEIIKEIVSLRLERAKLLGYPSHAHYVLAENMALVPGNVYQLLKQLWQPALKRARAEAADMQALIDKAGKNFKLQPWDWWYYAEKVRKAKFDLDEEAIKPYFKLENVRDGVFYVTNRLFGLKFIERKDIPKYHPDVQVFEVQEADGSHLGIIYLDYFPRASKRGGAWMSAFRSQHRKEGQMIHPVVTNNGNFTKPAGELPSLLSSDEVETLFHEFGHALHGLLSDCTYEPTAGLEVALDFVELPSQIMENWVYEPEVLKVYARHWRTGEVIPQELIEKIKKSQLFNQGFETVEYLAASFLDMDWHTLTAIPADLDVEKFSAEAAKRIGSIPEIEPRYHSPYFRHIFSGMYSAGYYSYVWAEVIDADAFQAFKETSLFDQKTAHAFREHILSKGSSEEPMVLYKKFRGREPKIAPLLKKRGLDN